MHAVPVGNPDLVIQFKNETPQQTRSSSNVTGAVPAKRVTFFKSGDSQFGGVRMAIHKRSFKSFDALLDDLSQRVSLPFGVRTITTPHGTHSISHLEQLEDGGCYLCSDRRHVKPVNIDATRKRPTVWHHSHLHNIRRKPSRPEEAPTTHSSHRYPRHPKRIVLVKNSDPAVRRSIILSKRTARSLRVFMEEISELMQCHVRKLYTLEGRKIDSIQSLTQCPSVLVCVGREPFRPLQMESVRKSSDEKLPGLASWSRSSVCSEGHDRKKNVNFGLETKKSIIHPRSDSSNRSTRFSLSSEKSYANGMNVTPSNTDCFGTCPHAKESLMNDDIEKRVLVNKDGSLSVEMKVRFRLLSDETLQWSTEIKKSVGTVNDSSLEKEDSHYLQHVKSESISDPEFSAPCDTEETYKTKQQPRHFEETHCQHCCNHCQGYDIWKNPLHGDLGAVRNIHSSSSSASSQKIVCKKASVDNMHMMSRSSEEYTEHVVQKATCFQQTVKGGDTRVEYCTISRCCSRSEVCALTANKASTEEKCESPENVDTRSNSVASLTSRCSQKDQVSVKITQVSEERPVSTISNSSKILEEFKEDQDDDEDDELPPSVSQASLWSQSDNVEDCECARSVASYCSAATHKSVSSINHLCPRPPSKTSVSSTHSEKFRNQSKSVSPTPEVPADKEEELGEKSKERIDSVMSSVSNGSSRSTKYYKPRDGVSDSVSFVSENVKGEGAEENDSRASSTLSKCSKALRLSNQSPDIESLEAQPLSVVSQLPPSEDISEANRQTAEERESSTISTAPKSSGSPKKLNICPHCGGSDRVARPKSRKFQIPSDLTETGLRSGSALSGKTNILERSVMSDKSKCSTPHLQGEEEAEERVDSSISASPIFIKSDKFNEQYVKDIAEEKTEITGLGIRNTSAPSNKFTKLENASEPNEKPEERSVSALSVKSNASAQSRTCSRSENKDGEDEQEVETEQRTLSATSSKTNASGRCKKSIKSNCATSMRATTPKSDKSDGLVDKNVDGEEEHIGKRVSSAMSERTGTSSKSRRSNKSNISEKAITPMSDNPCEEETEAKPDLAERALSAISGKTSISATSRKSKKSYCISSKRAVNTELTDERANSAMSHKSNTSERSKTPNKPECTAGSSVLEVPVHEKNGAAVEDVEERPSSNLSVSTKTSWKSKFSKDNVCSASDRASSPATSLPPKICGGEKDTEIEDGEDRVGSSLSVNSKVSGRSKKSHICIDQAAEEIVEDAVSAASARSIQSLKSKKNDEVECSTSDRASTPTLAKDGAGDRVFSAMSQSTKSKSLHSNKSAWATPNSLTPEPADGKEVGPGTADTEQRPNSTASLSSKVSQQSKNSDHHFSKQVTIPTLSASETLLSNEDEIASVKSACTKISSKSKNCSQSPTRELRPKSRGSSLSRHSCRDNDTENSEQCVNESGTIVEKLKALESNNEKKPSSNNSKSPSQCSKSKTTAADAISFVTSRPASSASARSTLSRSKAKDNIDTNMEGGPKSNASEVSSSLQNNMKPGTEDDHEDTVKTSIKSYKKGTQEQRPNSAATSDTSQNFLNPTPPPKKNKRPEVQIGNSHDSDLSHSLSAADLLRERLAKVKPDIGEYKRNTSNQTCNALETSDASKPVSDDKSDNGPRYRHRKSSSSSWQRREGEDVSEIVPSSLPNASPTEVVHEWLKKIPADSPMYEMGEDFHECPDETQEDIPEKVEHLKEESIKLTDEVVEPDAPNEQESENKVEANEKHCFEVPTKAKQPSAEKPIKLPSRDALPKTCQSSVQVMKVLLSPKLDRCNSLPEVSPVYGRKLSTSAKGLLDCLANLQLIDSDPVDGSARDDRYNELLTILQSLWLCEPPESEQGNTFKTHRSVEDPKSSSGVDVSSGSAGSGKGSDNGAVNRTQKVELLQTTVAPLAEQDVEEPLQKETEKNEDKESCPASPRFTLDTEYHAVLSDPATPDIASRVQGSPVSEETGNEEQKREEGPGSNETIRSDGSPKEIIETPSSSNKSSGNGSNILKSRDEVEADLQEGASSRTLEKIKFSKKPSQDPDPVWVLNLLKKLEKQFMTHYVNAMAEFKVRWDLDDSEMLDTMINELRDEVRKRIQTSINRELQKIQSRAGKEPRPPVKALSRDSIVQTEQRRRRLKVMRNKSINESLRRSDENYTPTGTDFSDQRSEDEYCPCDACMKKKLASKLVERKTVVTTAPVMMDFDLRKILQMKKDPRTTAKTGTILEVKPNTPEVKGKENKNENLEVLEEEAEVDGKGKDSVKENNKENCEAELQAEKEEGDTQNTHSMKAHGNNAADEKVDDVSPDHEERNEENIDEKAEDTAGEEVEETAESVKESEAVGVVEEGDRGEENKVGSSEEMPEENARGTEAAEDDTEENSAEENDVTEEVEAIQENDADEEGNGAEINDVVVKNDAAEADDDIEKVVEETEDADNDEAMEQSEKDEFPENEFAELSEAAGASEQDQTADDDAVEESGVTEEGEVAKEAKGDVAETSEGEGDTADSNGRTDEGSADSEEKVKEHGQEQAVTDETMNEDICTEAGKAPENADIEDDSDVIEHLQGSNFEKKMENKKTASNEEENCLHGKSDEEETTLNNDQEGHRYGSDKAEEEAEEDDAVDVMALKEDKTDIAVQGDVKKEQICEENEALKTQESENSDDDAKECATEGDGEASDSSCHHDSNVSEDTVKATQLDKPEGTTASKEDIAEICGVETLTTEKAQVGSEELERSEDEECRSALIKQITVSSIESQPGSLETALDQETKLKDTKGPTEGSSPPSQEEATGSLSLPPKGSKHRILSRRGEKQAVPPKKEPIVKINKSRRQKDSGLK